MNNILLKSR